MATGRYDRSTSRWCTRLGAALIASGWLLGGIGGRAIVAAQSGTDTSTTPPTPDTAPAPAPEATPAPEAAPAPEPPPPPPPPPPDAPAPFTVGDAPSEKVSLDAPKADTTALNASLGGSLNTGNTKSYLLNAGGEFRLIRAPHSLSINAAFAYGRAAIAGAPPPNPLLETVKNLNAKARYDIFLDSMDALFAATGFRWDPFAGIDRRNQGQIGYARYFVAQPAQRFWGEVGYDLTSDSLRELPMQPPPDPRHPVIHSVRLFTGYDNQLNAAVTYLGGVEVLLDVKQAKDVRVNWDNALRSALSDQFKLELKFRLAFDNVPVPGAKKTDTVTLISVLYSMI
jgi:putative salt-induced outer membrane protein YdiY